MIRNKKRKERADKEKQMDIYIEKRMDWYKERNRYIIYRERNE